MRFINRYHGARQAGCKSGAAEAEDLLLPGSARGLWLPSCFDARALPSIARSLDTRPALGCLSPRQTGAKQFWSYGHVAAQPQPTQSCACRGLGGLFRCLTAAVSCSVAICQGTCARLRSRICSTNLVRPSVSEPRTSLIQPIASDPGNDGQAAYATSTSKHPAGLLSSASSSLRMPGERSFSLSQSTIHSLLSLKIGMPCL